MLVVISGELIGETEIDTSEEYQLSQFKTKKVKRNLFAGSTINILSILKLWDKCIETVVATQSVETYAVSQDDFVSLFFTDTSKSGSGSGSFGGEGSSQDSDVFQHLQIKESFNFKMDKSKITPNAPLGQPMYAPFMHYFDLILTCFSLFECECDSYQSVIYNTLSTVGISYVIPLWRSFCATSK